MKRLPLCIWLCALSFSALGGAAVSPDLSGEWTGSAAGSAYFFTPEGTPTVSPALFTFNATLVHSGTALTMNAVINNPAGGTIPVTLTGNAGNFALWVAGGQPAPTGLQQVFISGQFTKKGDKITGVVVTYRFGFSAQLNYNLSKTGGSAQAATINMGASRARAASASHADQPYTAAGKLSGKSYTFASNEKAAKYAASITINFDPANLAAGVTIVGPDGTLTFDTTDSGTQGALVLSGSGGLGGSENFVCFLKLKKNGSASGMGWIYSATRLVECKISTKKK